MDCGHNGKLDDGSMISTRFDITEFKNVSGRVYTVPMCREGNRIVQIEVSSKFLCKLALDTIRNM